MNKRDLKKLIKEEMDSVKLDKTIEDNIDKFGSLTKRIEELSDELKKVKSELNVVQSELSPTLALLDGVTRKSIQTNKFIIELSKKGYETTNPKYKEAFNLALTKVNEATKNVLNEAFNATKTISKVAAKLKVKSIDEISIEGIVKYVKDKYNKIKTLVTGWNTSVNQLNSIINKMK